ncbi:MAG: hypothetical protein WCX64_03010 [Candidatus Micrarchaeia archaeon]
MATDSAAAGSTRASAAIAVADPAKESFSFQNPLDEVDESKKLGLFLFLVLLVVFGFSLYCYSRIGLDFGPVCDVFNASQTLAKLVSPAALMFVFLFSLSIAIAAAASRGLGVREAAILSAMASLLPAIVLGCVFSSYICPFIGFAVAIIAASFFACRLPPESASFTGAYSMVGRAILVFTIVACILTFIVVSQQREQYFGEFFSGLAGASPIVMAQGAGVLSKVVANFQVTPAQLENFMPREEILMQLRQQARSQVEALSPRESVRANLLASDPGFSSLSASEQEGMINGTYAAAVLKIINETNEDALVNATYAELSVQAGSLKNNLAGALNDYANKPPKKLTAQEIANVKSQLLNDPSYVQLHDMFPIAMALLVWSLLSLAMIPVRLLASLLAFFGFKLQKQAG